MAIPNILFWPQDNYNICDGSEFFAEKSASSAFGMHSNFFWLFMNISEIDESGNGLEPISTKPLRKLNQWVWVITETNNVIWHH